MPVAPRIVNDVSYERRINHDIPLHIIQRSSTKSEVSGSNADFIFVLAA